MIERVTSDQGLAQERGREVMLVNFSRPSLGQTGSGHFSPIAAWHPASDMALVLDTARFKYPAFWAPVNKVGGREGRGREAEREEEGRVGWWCVSQCASACNVCADARTRSRGVASRSMPKC